MSIVSSNAMPSSLGHHHIMHYNVPPPGYVNSESNNGMVNGQPNTLHMFIHGYPPGFAPHMLPCSPPAHREVFPGPGPAYPINQTQMYRAPPPAQMATFDHQRPQEPCTNLRKGPPPPYYPSTQMNSQPEHTVYSGHQISHPQKWFLHQNQSLPFQLQYPPKIPISHVGNYSPPPSIHILPHNPPLYTPPYFVVPPQLYQPPMSPTAVQYQHHSFIPFPTPSQINPTLNHCNVQFNASSGTPCPNVTAREFDGAVYYSYNGQGPPAQPPLQSQHAEMQHFYKQEINQEAASHIVNQTADGEMAGGDVVTESNLPTYRRLKPRRHWKKKNH